MARVKKDPEERKTEIFEAAKRLFAENGYDKTTVSDIVKEVGVSQGTFYWYFDSKEAILEAVADDFASKMYDSLEAILSDERVDAGVKLERFFKLMDKAGREGGQLVEELHAPEHRRHHEMMAKRLGNRMILLVRGLIIEGIEEGLFDVPDPEAAALFIIVPGVFANVDFEIPLVSQMSKRRWVKAYRDMAYRILGYSPDRI